MNLKTRTACQWLAVPLTALAIAACGDSDNPAPAGPCDGGLAAPCEPQPGTPDYAELYPECGDGYVTGEEDCDLGDGENGGQNATCTSECTDVTCGDGERNAGEACDDGNTAGGDGCQSDCALPTCGDGEVDDEEECDDGNRSNDDGCSSRCLEESCGDGVVNGDEECDDGNQNGRQGSGCTAVCEENECGDGHQGGSEACDDGNTEDGDECTARCGLPRCGNGIEEAGEECDDGNTSDRDACLSSCVTAFCGDGEVQNGEEECDDGNRTNNDGCSNDCVIATCGDGIVQQGEACDEGSENGAPGGTCTANCGNTTCGNGVVEAGEECDDGNTSNRDSCLTSCVWNSCGDGEIYSNASDDGNPNALEECDDENNSNGDTCTNACMTNVCGDGYQGPGEACDEGAENGATGGTCSDECELPTCGNSIVEAGEDCDDGNEDDTDSCASCQWNECGDGTPYLTATDAANTNELEECDDGDENNNNTCTNACTTAVCGDGIVGPGEGCDDGNDVDGDGCNSCVGPDCGNGVVDPNEQCDDGNPSNTDACLTSCVWNSCGDGNTYLAAGVDADNPNPVEECDDANGSNEDGCLNTCEANVCGDGFRNPATETCDLGAMNGPGSTCSLLCTPSACGNGMIDPGEECDDGTAAGNLAWDSCTSVCTWNECGDGAVYAVVSNNSNPNPLEQCDDANDDNTDLCTTACNYNACGDTFLLDSVSGYRSEPYDDPDGTGPMTPSRGGLDSALTMVPYWNVGQPSEIRPSDFAKNSEECENPSATGACVSSDFDGDGINECRNAKCGDGFVQAGVEQCDENEDLVSCPGGTCAGGICAGGTRAGKDCNPHDDNTDGCLDTCQTATCGDGWVRNDGVANEVCDDGNTDNTDLCVACNNPVCGDGIVQIGEACDTGPDRGAAPAICSQTCTFNSCGDGVRQAHEDCDQGCGAGGTCSVAPGSGTPGTCTGGPRNGQVCGGNNDQCLDNCRFNVCGDSQQYTTTVAGDPSNQPLEACDDGNSNNRDACTDTCAAAKCGDGFVEFGVEECDDGNTVDDDECSNSCGEPACGDGILQDGEECDDGGTCAAGIYAGQACGDDDDCVIDYGTCAATCTNSLSSGDVCTSNAQCNDQGTCAGTCSGGPTGACTDATDCGTSCLFVCNEATGRTPIACTDDSECPYGDNDTIIEDSCQNGFCRTACSDDSDCSNGEACLDGTGVGVCDDGDDGSTPLSCANDTQCGNSGAFTCDEVCSNGLGACTNDTQCLQTGVCDLALGSVNRVCDGGDRDGLGCDLVDQCPGGQCDPSTETCDGGSRDTLNCNPNVDCANTAACVAQDADGCHNADPPSNAVSGDEEPLCAFSTCGDGILDLDEGCELDGEGDMLYHGAAPAPRLTCNVATCTLSSCGANAGVQNGEECDDGNVSDTDGCTNRCRAARCGDGIVQGTEECDDGNPTETDNCTNACRWNVCGDGIRMDAAPSANSPAQVCDTGAVTTPAAPGGAPADYYMFTRGRNDGDGYDDQPAWCNASTCNIVCDGTNSVSAAPWRNGTSCILAAEEYPLAPVVPGTADNYLTDNTYTPFTRSWDDAEEYCEDLGIDAKLVKFENTTDRDTVDALMAAIGGSEIWWVGAEENDAVAPTNPPTFVWLDGAAIPGTMFAINEPSGPNGNCLVTDGTAAPGGSLRDESCGPADTEKFFCEYAGPFPRSAAP